jgi:hypothetical protein
MGCENCVVGNRVPLAQFAACQHRVRQRIAANKEERRARAFASERVEHARSGGGLGAIVEGEHDLLGRERQRLRKMLAANSRRRGRIHDENAGSAESIRIAGAGDYLAPHECRAQRKHRDRERASHRPLLIHSTM